MVDENLKPWLIEVNTNPCLETTCPLLQQIIPEMLEQTLRITVDCLFPPPQEWNPSRKMWTGEDPLKSNMFQLIFEESEFGMLAEGVLQPEADL